MSGDNAFPYMVVRSRGDSRYVRDRRTGCDIGPMPWQEAWRLREELNRDPARPQCPGEAPQPGGRR